ncbi:MAG: LamG domain-containing protein [Candidatus Pacebacteria bacterium]|nr:LamG domain-containing protein [Candidatus Paceibacterota bacterium]
MKKNTSFTLIELLVVIVIIGVIAGVIIVTTTSSIGKANITKLKVFEESVANNLAANMVSRWKLDDVIETNKTPDAWGNNKGTLYFDSLTPGAGDSGTSGPMSEANCISGTCFKFDGDDDYISMGVIFPQYNILSLSVWVYPTGSKEKTVHGASASSYSKHSFNIGIDNANKAYFRYLWDDSGTTTSVTIQGPNINLNQWNNLVVVFNQIENYVLFYVNGSKFIGNVDFLEKPIRLSPELQDYNIGRLGGATTKFNGLIDDVRIYDAALSSSQIKQNYIAGLNSLLSKGLISEGEYNERIESLSQK